MVGDSIIPWVTDRDESRSVKLPSKNKFVKYRYQHQQPTTNNQQPTTNNKGSWNGLSQSSIYKVTKYKYL
jgi:hypothetical protein